MFRRFRVVTLFVLVACTASTSSKPLDRKPTLTMWVARWAEARTCLVAPAEDLERGVELAMESGRNCSPLLQQLDVEVPLATAMQEQLFLIARPLSRMIDTAHSPSKRAAIIDDLDKTVAELERLVREGE